MQMKCNKNKIIIYLKKETQSVNKITISIRLAALNFNFISIKHINLGWRQNGVSSYQFDFHAGWWLKNEWIYFNAFSSNC